MDAINEFRVRTAAFMSDWRSIDVRIVAFVWRDKWVAEGLRAVLLHDDPSEFPAETDLPRGNGLMVVNEVWAAGRLDDLLSGIERGEIVVGVETVLVGRADREKVSPFTSLWHSWDDRDRALSSFGMDWMTFSISYSQDHSRTSEESRAVDAIVRSATPSWDGVEELKRGFLGSRRFPGTRNQAFVEVLAPVEVRIASAELKGGMLHAAIDMHPRLDPGRLGAWVLAKTRDGATHRIPVPGPRVGPLDVPVPPDTSRATVIVLYRGADVDRAVAVPPEAAHRVAIYDHLMKGGVANLEERLRQAKGTALERPVAWLFHLLGFPTGHYGTESEAPDLVAFSPDGPFLVVECTSGETDLTAKLTKLAMRAKRLQETAGGREAIPVLVASFSRALMNKTDLDKASTDRVAVVTLEESLQLLDLAKTGAELSETLGYIRGFVPPGM